MVSSSELQQVISAPSIVTRFWVALVGAAVVGGIWAAITQKNINALLEVQAINVMTISNLTIAIESQRAQTEIYRQLSAERIRRLEMQQDVLTDRVNGRGQ